MHNKYEQLETSDYKMIEAYINKPEVTAWYVNAFQHFSINGVDVLRWHWSWWAFFGSVFYLLYRKSYSQAGMLLVFYVIGWFIPFGWFVLWILTGGYGPYAVYKTYKEKKLEVEATIEDEQKRLDTMQVLGGTNEWAIFVGVIAQLFIWSTAIFMIGFIVASLSLIGVILGTSS